MEENNKLITHHNKWIWGETWNLVYGGGIGIVQVAFADDESDVEVRGLSVLPEYRGQGIGRLLMAEIEKLQYPRKPDLFKVWVEKESVGLIGWYEDLGYKNLGETCGDGYAEMIKAPET